MREPFTEDGGSNMIRVMAVGVFDLLHAGHLHYMSKLNLLETI